MVVRQEIQRTDSSSRTCRTLFLTRHASMEDLGAPL